MNDLLELLTDFFTCNVEVPLWCAVVGGICSACWIVGLCFVFAFVWMGRSIDEEAG